MSILKADVGDLVIVTNTKHSQAGRVGRIVWIETLNSGEPTVHFRGDPVDKTEKVKRVDLRRLEVYDS